VSELVPIEIADVDLDHCKIFIDQGQGSKDRHILLPESLRLVLKSHLKANPKKLRLFDSQRSGPFSPRRVQQIVHEYRQRAGIAQPGHPHLFHHQMLTYLSAQGLYDAQIQLLSGHRTKKSLAVYQHLSLQAVRSAYPKALRSLNI
jgi:integrase/recombinase XerD